MRIDPTDVEAHVDLGYCLLYQAKLDEADASFDSILESETGPRARSQRASRGVDRTRPARPRPRRLFRESLRLDPQDEFALVGIGGDRQSGVPRRARPCRGRPTGLNSPPPRSRQPTDQVQPHCKRAQLRVWPRRRIQLLVSPPDSARWTWAGPELY